MLSKLHERANVLGCETRVSILRVLSKLDEAPTIAHIAQVVGVRPSVCSKHIELLELSGFVEKHRSGKYRLIVLNVEGLREFVKDISKLMGIGLDDDIWN